MKNKIVLLLFPILILVIVLLLTHRDSYIIKVEKIDNFSPDRKLIVYKNDKEIEFQELQYTDGTYLCSGKNASVSYGEIKDEKKLIIKINDKKQVIAKIVEK